VYTGGFQGRQRLSSVDPSTPSPLLPLVTAKLRGVPGSLGGREILYKGRPRIPSYSSPAATSISSPMVSSLLQISGDSGGSDVFFSSLGKRLVVLFLIAFGMELLGVPMVGLFGCIGDSIANGGFGFQEVARGHPMDGLPRFGTRRLPPLVCSSAKVLSLQWPVWMWSMGVHRCRCVFEGPGRWLLWNIPSFGAATVD
jgi:hypothetical protein